MRYLPIFIVTLLALILRLYDIHNGLIFGYDQARDAYRVTSIWRDKNLLLLGPETDIPGVHHGVGYYYLLAIPYALSASPVAAAIFFAVIQGLFTVFFYFSLIVVFGSRRIAITISVLYAVSFEMVQYARWLANPSLGAPVAYLLWYFLFRYMRGDQRSLLAAFAVAGLAVHFQLFLLYLSLLVFLLPLILRKTFRPVTYVIGLAIYSIFILPFIAAEIRFRGQLTWAFLNFLSRAGTYHSPIELLGKVAFRLNSVIMHTLFPDFSFIAITIFFGSLIYAINVLIFRQTKPLTKNALKLLLVWHSLTYAVYLFSSGAVQTEFSFVGGVISIIILAGYMIGRLTSGKYKIIAISAGAILILFHIRSAIVHAASGSYLFSVQQNMTWGLEKQIVDYTYAQADNKQFSICTLTNPFYVNTMWAYVYKTYGRQTYGYVPYWAGTDQLQNLGGDDLPADTDKPPLRFLIYEPPWGMPDYMPAYFQSIENFISAIEETKIFGEFIIEKRRLISTEMLADNETSMEYQRLLERGTLFSCYH